MKKNDVINYSPEPPIHLQIVDECVNIDNPACPKIFNEDGVKKCCTYLDPAAVQHRGGIFDACGVMPRPDKAAIKKTKLKRKFGSRTR
jgi:hypothetical protein